MEEEDAKQAIHDLNERLVSNSFLYGSCNGLTAIQGIPQHKYAYVSAMDASGVTISGHPESLSKLVKSLELDGNSTIRLLRSRGLYHAPHLYSNATIDEILAIEDLSSVDLLVTSKPSTPIYSPFNGKQYEATSTIDLLEKVITDILMEPQDDRLVLQECASRVSAFGENCRAIPIGPMTDPTVFVSSLHKESQSHVALEKGAKEAQKGSRGSAARSNSKIAIVGMSGRFPGASDVHEFWQVLQKGRDMHKKVRLTCESSVSF